MKNLKFKKNVIIFLSLVFLFTVFTEAGAITISVDIKGKGGTVIDSKSGKATVCPESANSVCATITVSLDSQVSTGSLGINRNNKIGLLDWTKTQGFLYVAETGKFVEVEITNATEVEVDLDWNVATLRDVKVQTFK